MSDLISRSKVISVLEQLEEHSLSSKMDISNAIYLLKNQPTDYSVDKIIKELEELKMRYFLTIANTGDEKSDFAYENVGNALDNAIEIVKHGGVSDDVCEWKKSKDYPFDWLVGCDGCEVNNRQGDYCPRCGKKIKIVGD